MTTTHENSPGVRETGLLQWSVTEHPNEVEVAIHGELDLATAATLTEVLIDLAAPGRRRVRCDFSGVSFLDSTGIRALLTAAEGATLVDSIVTVSNPTP